ncbi:hypothetical protein [Nonomuraea rubra]|uniref:hypothetical protein n=1 Tax=Nonomuraea rubra TaxID=46180 RepID=UPI0031E74644
MRQYAGNRAGLAIVGAALLGAGGYAWLRGHDRFFELPPTAKVLPAQAHRALAEDPWPLWFLALGLLLLALVALRWLLVGLGWGRRGHPQRHGHGHAVRRAQGRGRAEQDGGAGRGGRPAHRPDLPGGGRRGRGW